MTGYVLPFESCVWECGRVSDFSLIRLNAQTLIPHSVLCTNFYTDR